MLRCSKCGHKVDDSVNYCTNCGGSIRPIEQSETKSNDPDKLEPSATFYSQAWDEVNNKNTDKAVWAKAFSVAQGDEKKTQAKYIELRAAQLQKQQYEQESAKVFIFKPQKMEKGSATCFVCQRASVKKALLYCEEKNIYLHQKCFNKVDFNTRIDGMEYTGKRLL